MKPRSSSAVLLVLALLLAACDSGEAELSTTSSLVTGTTETPAEEATTTTGAGDGVVTETTLRGETVTSYEVTARISTDNGEILHIVIPEGAYTDVDLENFVGDLLDQNSDLWGAEVFDSEDGPAAFATPEDQRTAEQQQTLDEHHFVSLIGGDTIKYRGPFSEFGEMLIGS